MKQQPLKIKYKKSHKKKTFKGKKGFHLFLFGIGLKIQKNKYLEYKQFESFRKIISRKLKTKEMKNKKNLKFLRGATKKKKKIKKTRKKFLIFRTNINAPLTKKPLQVRMGKGKGSPYTYIFPAGKNRIITEMSRKSFAWKKITNILKKAKKKLPLKSKIIYSKKFLRKEYYKKNLKIFSKRKKLTNPKDGIFSLYLQKNYR